MLTADADALTSARLCSKPACPPWCTRPTQGTLPAALLRHALHQRSSIVNQRSATYGHNGSRGLHLQWAGADRSMHGRPQVHHLLQMLRRAAADHRLLQHAGSICSGLAMRPARHMGSPASSAGPPWRHLNRLGKTRTCPAGTAHSAYAAAREPPEVTARTQAECRSSDRSALHPRSGSTGRLCPGSCCAARRAAARLCGPRTCHLPAASGARPRADASQGKLSPAIRAAASASSWPASLKSSRSAAGCRKGCSCQYSA